MTAGDDNAGWSGMGSGLDDWVSSLLLNGNDLYVGGIFSRAGVVLDLNRIAKYDLTVGDSDIGWEGLGDGLRGFNTPAVYSMIDSGEDLYVGGSFEIAGGKPASKFARWSGLTAVPDQVVLTTPTDAATDVAVVPTLEWNAATGATTYELQVSTVNTFATTVIDETGLTGLNFTPGTALNHATEYFWRVRAVNVGGEGAWSTPHSFTTIPDLPETPKLLHPYANKADVSVQPEFDWDQLPNNETYELQVSTNQFFGKTIIYVKELEQSLYTPTEYLPPSTLIYWRVRSQNEHGFSEWSDALRFTTVAAQEPDPVRNLTIVPYKQVQKQTESHTVQNTDSFMLTWSPPEYDGGLPITDYHVIYRELNSSQWITHDYEVGTDTFAIVDGFTPGKTYEFDVLAENGFGKSTPNEDAPIVVSIESEELPTQVTLSQNYPNPFNPATTIRFALPVSGEVRLEVYSILGQRMVLLVSGQQPAGWHTVQLDASNWSSGTYIYRLQTGGSILTKKFLLVK